MLPGTVRDRGSPQMKQGLSMLALAVALVAFCGRPASVHARPFAEPLETGIPIAQGCVASGD
jgi:hypothetical protein